MNREVVSGGGASVYPLTGDILSVPGTAPVSVTGLLGVPMQPVGTEDQEFLVYDQSTNNWIPRLIVPADLPIATTTTLGAVEADGTTITVTSGGTISAVSSPTLTLETNGAVNSTQTLLNLKAGTNVTLSETAGAVTITSAAPAGVTLETNGTPNSPQTLLNLVAGVNITLSESAGSVTIAAATPTGASTIITNLQPGSVLTGTGSAQTVLTFTIAANTIPPSKGVEFYFSCEGSTGVFASNLWGITIGGVALGWNAVSNTSGYASGGVRVVNNNSSATVNSIVMLPLFQNTTAGTEVTAGPLQTSTFDTTSPIVVDLTWNGPNTITTQVIQAYLRFI